MTTEFRREVVVTPAWDKRHPDPKKNYGIHCCDLIMYLHGPKATIQFVVMTGWYLPENQEAMTDIRNTFPLATDIGYHADEPQYEDQQRMACDRRPQGFCYYDGSSLRAHNIWEVMLAEGSEAVWKEMEKEYNSLHF